MRISFGIPRAVPLAVSRGTPWEPVEAPTVHDANPHQGKALFCRFGDEADLILRPRAVVGLEPIAEWLEARPATPTTAKMGI
jgi:hypothetical protein